MEKKITVWPKAVENNDEWKLEFEISNGLGFVENPTVKELIAALEFMPGSTMLRSLSMATIPGQHRANVVMSFQDFSA